MSAPTPANLGRAACLLAGLSVRHPIPYLGSVPLKIDPSVVEGVAEALDEAEQRGRETALPEAATRILANRQAELDAAEQRGFDRAVHSTAIASIHKAVAAERAAIVAWLRTAAAGCGAYSGASFDIAAGKIEAGDHHPKEPE